MWNVVIISKWHVNQGIFVNLERDSMKIRPMTIFFFKILSQKKVVNQVKYNEQKWQLYMGGTWATPIMTNPLMIG